MTSFAQASSSPSERFRLTGNTYFKQAFGNSPLPTATEKIDAARRAILEYTHACEVAKRDKVVDEWLSSMKNKGSTELRLAPMLEFEKLEEW